MANVIDKVAGLVVGPQGPQGPQGPKGDTGQTGPQGATGATGATPNLTMGTVTTLEPDSPATATITGTAKNPVLNLGIPKGKADVDDTLSTAGKAADAKKTGDKLESLKSDLTALDDGEIPIRLSFTPEYASAPTARSNNASVDSTDVVTIEINSGYSYAYIVLDANGDTVSGSGWLTQPTTLQINRWSDVTQFCVRVKDNSSNPITEQAAYDAVTIYKASKIELKISELEFGTSCYVDSVNGDDTNDGSASHPFRTIQKAIDSGFENIYAKPYKKGIGGYSESLTIANKKRVRIMPTGYQTAYTTNQDKPVVYLHATGDYGILVRETEEFEIYGFEIAGSTKALFKALNVGHIRCENVYVHSNDTQHTFQHSGFELYNVNGVFVWCKAQDIDRDGFNIHGYGYTEFIDCIAFNCADDGISHHDGCEGVIRGGEFFNCGKAGVASPAYGAIVDITGVYVHDNTQYGIYAVSDSNSAQSSAKISNCLIKDNAVKDIYADYADMIGWNNIYDTKQITANATFLEY